MEILSIIDVVLSDCTVNLTNHLLQTIKRTVIPPKKQELVRISFLCL